MDRLFAQELPESVIKRLSIEAKRLGAINFGQGIPPFPTAPHIIDAAREALNEPDIGVYPNFLGSVELRQAIGTKFSLDPEKNILVTVGAMEGTATAILSLINNGDRVGVITPDYCNHFPEIQLARGKVIEISMKEGKAWQLDFDLIEKEAKAGMRLLILTNPNNPTGAVVNREDLKVLVDLSEKYGFWLLADETYYFLTYGEKAGSLLDFWSKSERLIVVRSFSKEYAMTGWRVGYCIAHESALKVFAKTHDALVGCTPKISQIAAHAAITGPQTIVDEYRKEYAKLRQIAIDALAGCKGISFTVPEGAYYLFLKSPISAETILRDAGVALVPGAVFGKAGKGYLRLSFAAKEDVLRDGLTRLVKFLR